MRRLFLLGGLLLAAWSPLLADHPAVEEGNDRLRAGDAEGALRSYRRAEEELGPRPEIDYDRGAALYRMGRYGEARDSFQKALDAPGLGSRDAYNLGNTLARMGDPEGALRAFQRALSLDPSNEDARYNLEVMRRRLREGRRDPPPEEQVAPQAENRTPDGGTRDGGENPEPTDGGQVSAQDGGRDGGSQGDRADGGAAAAREEQQAGGSPDGGRPPEPRAGRPERPEGGTGAARRPADLSQQEAERLLDAMRERERNMPMRPAGDRRRKEPDVEKDW
jgi:tetratricopeptide (TPR) repeat protein